MADTIEVTELVATTVVVTAPGEAVAITEAVTDAVKVVELGEAVAVTEAVTETVEVVEAGPQGPAGLQGPAGPQNLYTQQAVPTSAGPWVWFEIDGAGDLVTVWLGP